MRNMALKKLLTTKHAFLIKRTLLTDGSRPRVLITGGLGQLGLDLTAELRKRYGKENVILTDVSKQSRVVTDDMQREMSKQGTDGPFAYLDISDLNSLHKIVVDNEINCVVHYAALLSALAETNVNLASQVNIMGTTNILELSRIHKLKVFIPSTIGVFGPDTPRERTPNITIQRPRTIYGVSKVFGELLGEYYVYKYGVDFRSLRFPGIVSANAYEGAGTTDYAAKSFHKCMKDGSFSCDLKRETYLPMMYIGDCTKSVIDFMLTPESQLKQRTYNINAMSFCPEQLEKQIQRRIPNAKFKYEVDPMRQKIAESWPVSLDDSDARHDWGWNPEYDLEKMTDVMIEKISQQTK